MRVLTVANQKGGVGKTTSSVALAGLAAGQGQRVLLLDLDPHGSLSSYFRQDPDTLALSGFTLFQERNQLSFASVMRLIQATNVPGLDILPASTALATLERQSAGDGLGLVLSKALNLIASNYDWVIIDTPPVLGVLMINALAACDYLVIPVQTEFLALKGLERMVNTLSMMAKSRRKTPEYTIVPVMFDRRTQASVSSLSTVRHHWKEKVWPGHIPVDTRFRDASRAGVPPSLYDPNARGVEAYGSLFRFLQVQLQQQDARRVTEVPNAGIRR